MKGDADRAKALRKFVESIHDYRDWLHEQGLMGPPGMRDGVLRSMCDHIITSMPLVFHGISDVVYTPDEALAAVGIAKGAP